MLPEIMAKILVDMYDEQDCWEWPYTNAKGYGRVKVKGRYYYVHREMYAYINGPIADGMQVDHLCHNRSCCNPDHLEAVSHTENQRRRRDR